MAVLIASGLRKEWSGEPLFDRVSFKVESGDRVALAGPNGAGKTTLLRMLTGEIAPDGGELAFRKRTRIALHDQRPPRHSERGRVLSDYVFSGATDLIAAERDLARLERAMAGGAHDRATLDAYARAQAVLEHGGGYGWRERASAVVRGLGFADADLDRPLGTFSGGELTRASLARALAAEPDLLLLDEPTNHLDVTSIEWLEQELASLRAAVVLVAHDRWFLEAVTNATLELELGRATFFPGPWHAWRQEKAQRAAHAQKTAERISADIERLERFVARFRYKKEKAKQAQAKLTQISRLERERSAAATEHELLTRRSRALGFSFIDPPRSGRVVLELEGETVGVDGHVLLENVALALERGEHVALVGPNGSGKTTLLEAIVAGRYKLGHGVEIGYFSQHGTELDERGSALDCAMRMTKLNRPEAQSLLGRFLFSGWDAHEKPVAALSGGERRRLGLAVLVASGANFLVLDEPTNHLDLASREALEAALDAFPGTVLLVTHDRALIDAVAHRTAAVEGRTVRVYDGGWVDYLETRKPRVEEPEPVAPKRRSSPTPAQPKVDPLHDLEAQIEAQEQVIARIETELAADWSDVDRIAAHRRARADLHALLERWEALVDEVPS
ncbi:MAG TPA: ABC-F family ATP-binding cassette domain-containing protein [Gaiellaceae bacterium]|nr:ABC-F family ATP-binding cassette domain-containing protein [Gaiellaceae bacterium]